MTHPSKTPVPPDPRHLETLTLAGGCFWCLDAVYRRVRGVVRSECGYSNGNPNIAVNYEAVCRGDTGYAEVVQLTYDPTHVSAQELLAVFFCIHDPTTRNRQGNDVGTQYRSGIYFVNDSQQALSLQAINALQSAYNQPILTEVQPLALYSAAEAYHQDYFTHHPHAGYCAYVVAPKVQKYLDTFKHLVV